MEFTRVRSPSTFSSATPFRQRPGGPRSPKSSPSGPAKAMVPLDLSTRVEEATPAYSSPRSSTWSPSSPRPTSEHDLQSEYGGSSASRRHTVSRAIQTGAPEPAPSTPSTPLVAAPAVKVIKKTPTLTPPPAVNFDAPPVPWRPMTFQTAQWSLTSEQLQDIVSTAIRASAEENFIRLVSKDTLDVELVQELERLDSLKATTQAQYRFNMQRRLMLLQSLNALSFAPGDPSSQAALSTLTAQLAALAASCDRLMETLLATADQRAQIQRLQDVHVASALAITLRKLNASYGRRVAALRDAHARIGALQAELEEAWGAAEELAQELDDLDNFGRDFGYEGGADDDAVLEDEASAVSRDGSVVVVADSRTERSVQLAELVGVSATATAAYAALCPGPIAPSPAQLQVADRSSRVKSARRRSVRTSKASLRLRQPSVSVSESEAPSPSVAAAAQTVRRARSRSRSRRRPTVSTEDAPMPTVPVVPAIRVDPAPSKTGSFLELSDTRPTTPSSAAQEAPPPPPPPPPLPAVAAINTARSRRNTLEVCSPPPNLTPSTPGFDRTIIPPFTFRAAHASRDDAFFPGEQEHEHGGEAGARRVQSLHARGDTASLFEGEARSPHRMSDGNVLLQCGREGGRGRAKAKRYSVPLRAASLQASQPPRPASAGAAATGPSIADLEEARRLQTGAREQELERVERQQEEQQERREPREEQHPGAAPSSQVHENQAVPDSLARALQEREQEQEQEQPPPLPPKDDAKPAEPPAP
ncbi:hypothetical protein DAEQUDRAFT_271798 [Daedalea quercina L-15889]|uniref:Uncharacterized protein n=1 Tax=Daedalea quercina L-15889 TaxID=1314783 RepID=A0A165QCX0_9APHY|nr:hypothetical protein DAEQUDRAFT_271798 [Daedalea quercina L-15889]